MYLLRGRECPRDARFHTSSRPICSPSIPLLTSPPLPPTLFPCSFGVVLWELLMRQRPYADADVPVFLLMMSLGNGSLTLPPLREDLAGAGTAGLARLCERCLQASALPPLLSFILPAPLLLWGHCTGHRAPPSQIMLPARVV